MNGIEFINSERFLADLRRQLRRVSQILLIVKTMAQRTKVSLQGVLSF